MDDGKILVVNLSKGLSGEDNAGILGSFLVTKIQLAAMSRSDIPNIADRRPFYLYVDEFQNFATDSFATILSEARKYGLNLTVANQYVAQMTDAVRDAVFGNVGTTISFRVSADDAPILVKQFDPTFEEGDLIQMNNRHFVISMIINGEKSPAFSATTLSLPKTPKDNFTAIIEQSRANYTRPREVVEAEISENINQSEKYKRELSDSGRVVGQNGQKLQGSTPVKIPGLELKTRQKPNLKPADLRKISPNSVSGESHPTLKDLGKLVATEKSTKPATKSKKPAGKQSASKSHHKKSPKHKKADSPSPTPVKTPKTAKTTPKATPKVTPKHPSSTPVTPPIKEIKHPNKTPDSHPNDHLLTIEH